MAILLHHHDDDVVVVPTSTMHSAASVPDSKHIPPPHHVLMTESSGSSALLDPKLSRDFISQRFQALQLQHQQQSTTASSSSTTTAPDGKQPPRPLSSSSGLDGEGVWLGVSKIERLLVSCCNSSEPIDDGWGESSSSLLGGSGGGALDTESSGVLRFTTALALHCHDLNSRVLALAILERSLQVDEREKMAIEEKIAETQSLFGGSSSSGEPPLKRARLNDEREEDSSSAPPSNPPITGRVHTFLAAGGWKILRQWLLEASTPVTVVTNKPPPPSVRPSYLLQQQVPPKTQPSPTGPLLLLLLQFLASIPFDKQLITNSKINKQIRTLSKQMDGFVASAAAGKDLTTATHEVAGGLPIVQVKQSLDHLKHVWEEKAKASSSSSSGSSNAKGSSSLAQHPLEKLRHALSEQLDAFNEYQQGKGDKPEWWTKLEEQRKAKELKKQNKALASTADLARRERENERAAMMREDLQKAQEQRRLLVIKLRELKQKSMNDVRQARQSKNKRAVRWKDGMGTSSREKNRELLEEVFAIPSKEDSKDQYELADVDEDDDIIEVILSDTDE